MSGSALALDFVVQIFLVLLGGLFTIVVWCILVSVAIRNLVSLAQLVVSYATARQRESSTSGTLELWLRNSSSAPFISVIAPAYNEELTIVSSLRSLLSLQYPALEIIVVNDGSSDQTINVVIEEFQLEQIEHKPQVFLHRTRVKAVYRSSNHPALLVIDKENGRKADAVNAGISYAKGELVCVIDADSVIDREGLLRAVEPFMSDEGSLVAVGGSIRIANGCQIENGQVSSIGIARAWLLRFQTLEYFRAFLCARLAYARMDILLLISGAFGLFRRDIVLEVGGYRHDTVGEDLEILVRMLRHMRETGRSGRVEFLPEACCWTEAPSTLIGLRNQRTRWQQGAIETILEHKSMLFDRRYGRLGWVALPLLLLEDLIGPPLELLGYFLIPVAWAFGWLAPDIALGFFVLTCLFGTVLSAGSLMIEEMQIRATPRARDLYYLIVAAFVENFGYRQILQYFRIRGIFHFLRGNKVWAAVPRTGFDHSLSKNSLVHYNGSDRRADRTSE